MFTFFARSNAVLICFFFIYWKHLVVICMTFFWILKLAVLCWKEKKIQYSYGSDSCFCFLTSRDNRCHWNCPEIAKRVAVEFCHHKHHALRPERTNRFSPVFFTIWISSVTVERARMRFLLVVTPFPNTIFRFSFPSNTDLGLRTFRFPERGFWWLCSTAAQINNYQSPSIGRVVMERQHNTTLADNDSTNRRGLMIVQCFPTSPVVRYLVVGSTLAPHLQPMMYWCLFIPVKYD